MLSFRVNALLQIGQWTLFSPVCFFPCRAACPDVVNVAEQLWLAAYGQGYLFFRDPLVWIESFDPLKDVCGEGGSAGEDMLKRRSEGNLVGGYV